ncbi:hypothetical protein, partial [uncultured Sphingobacterium sp.]|uniref:hypothetical protein n=1 Tax=uncultured Sphingobacterium sp. TaxID=182688 RepID=UPI00259186C1
DFYVVIQIFWELFLYVAKINLLYIRKLKGKQALLGSNLSAIGFLRYAVTLLSGGDLHPLFIVTDIA